MSSISDRDQQFLRLALDEAKKSPPKPTNFCVGAVLSSEDKILSTGYTLELEGNTHAEQCALTKFIQSDSHGTSKATNRPQSEALNMLLSPEANATLYTTMEPCSHRLSGNESCISRIIGTRKPDSASGIRKVVFGAKEPSDFVKDSQSCKLLDAAGVKWEYARDPQLETDILRVAKAGHGTILEERPPDQPANPKKRMMEL